MNKTKIIYFLKLKQRSARNNWLALFLLITATVAFGLFSLLGYYHLFHPTIDLGLYNKHMWDLVRLDFSANPFKGFNLVGDHAHFILFLLAPIYALYQSPLTLVIIQVLAVGLSGWPIYLVAKKYFKNKTAAALWLLPYYMYFGFWAALAYPFHIATISVLPLAWALYFLLEKKYSYLIPTLILMIIVKEDMPLVAIMMGVYMIIIQRKYKLGLIVAGLSGLYFIFVTKLFLPFASKSRYWYTDSSVSIKLLLTKPMIVIKSFILPSEKLKNIFYMLFSFGGFSVIGLEILVLLLPLWGGGRFLSIHPYRWTYGLHYSINQGPILAVAAIIGIGRIHFILAKAYRVKKKYLTIFLYAAIIFCVITSLAVWRQLDPRAMRLKPQWFSFKLSADETTAWQAIKMVLAHASVGVQSAFPQLTSRKVVTHTTL